MFTREDLVGLKFEGFFQNNFPIDRANAPKDDPIYSKEDFSIHICEFDSDTGLFLAKGNDVCGVSGLVGLINNDGVKFDKIYIGKDPLYEGLSRFPRLFYRGSIEKPINIITMRGDYFKTQFSEKTVGYWRLDSLPRAV